MNHLRSIRLFNYLLLIPLVFFWQKTIANVNYDSIAQVYQKIDSDKDLMSFVTFVENTDDVIGAANAMGMDQFKAILNNAQNYCSSTQNSVLSRRCLFYRYLLPYEKPKIEVLRIFEELRLYDDIKESNHYLKMLVSLRYIYGDLELFDQFLPMLEEIKKYGKHVYTDEDIEYMRFTDLSSLYYRTKNYRKALETYIQLGDLIKDKKGINESSRLNNMGLCYQQMRLNDSAILYFNKALVTYEFTLSMPEKDGEFVDSSFYYVIKSNIADIKVSKGDFEGAEQTFQRQLKYSSHYYSGHLVLSSFLSLAKLEYYHNNFTQALSYIDSIKHNYSKSGAVSYYIKGLKLKAKIYFERGARKLANKSEEEAAFLQDSILAVKAERNYQAAAIRLQVDEVNDNLALAKSDLIASKQRSNLLFYVLIFAALFIGLIVFTLFVLQRKNVLLSKQKDGLDSAVKEREILLREIHHRVKNNLNIVSSLLQLQSRRINDKSVKVVFKESQQYILSMSKVHQLLYEQNDMKHIGMEHYFESLLREMLTGYSSHDVDHVISANSINLKLDQALVLGILTSELVTNSMKYAFPTKTGTISITMRQQNGSVSYEYIDSGQGFDISDKDTNRSFGLKLIRMSAEQLRAAMNIESSGCFSVSLNFVMKK